VLGSKHQILDVGLLGVQSGGFLILYCVLAVSFYYHVLSIVEYSMEPIVKTSRFPNLKRTVSYSDFLD
jgi:hypothetical protein